MKQVRVKSIFAYSRLFVGKTSAVALIVALTLSAQQLNATPLYWDLNGAIANSGASGTGVWDGVNLFWNDNSSGTGGTAQAGTTSADDLTFSSGSGLTAGTITVSAGRVANSITFEESGIYTLNGGDITLSGATGLNFTNGTGANIINTALSLGANTAFTNSDNSTQTIGGGVIGAFNLTLNSNSSGGLTFSTGSVNNGGTITNSGSGTNTTTISSVIGSNVTGITQNSATSALALSGANTSYTGPITVSAGALTGTNTAATNVLTAFGTGTINLNGGTLNLRANGSANGSQNIITGNGTTGNNVVMGSGAATINVSNNSANSTNTISLNDLTLGSGQLNVTGANTYTLRFAGGTTLTADATINATTAPVSLVGVVSGSFGFTKRGSGSVTLSGLNTYTGSTSALEGFLILNGAAPSGSSGTLGNATSAVLLGNTTGAITSGILANDYTIARDIVVQAGNTGTVYLGSGSSTTNTTTFSGDIYLGSSSTGHNLNIASAANHNLTISGAIKDPVGLSGAGGVLTIGDATLVNGIVNNSNNNTNGSTTVLLSGNNTYSGGTIIDTSGSVRIGHDNAFGTGIISIVRGTITQSTSATALVNAAGMSWDGNFTLNSFTFGTTKAVNLGTVGAVLTGNRTLTVANGTSTVNGVISGSGRSLQVNSGTTTAGLSLGGANTFSGGLIVAGSATSALTVSSNNASALGTGQMTLTNSSNSRVSLGAATTVESLSSAINTSATVTNGGASALTAGTYALTIAGDGTGAAGTATVNASGVVTAVAITAVGSNYTTTPTISLSGSTAVITPTAFSSSSINLNPGTARTLTLSGTNLSAATYAGIISGTGGSLVKNGAGIQVLTGANTYTGGTVVNGGTLKVNNTTGSATGTGTLLIQNTATLSGGNGAAFSGATSTLGSATFTNYNSGVVGIISGASTIASGGHLAPGNSVGTLTIDTLNLNSGSILDYEFNLVSNDLTAVTAAGGLTFGTVGINLYQEGTVTGFSAAGLYNIFDYNTSFTGNLTDLSVLNPTSGYSYTFVNDTTNTLIQLQVVAVPEPSAYAMVGLGLVSLWALRRQKGKREA